MELTPKLVMIALLSLSGSVGGAWMGGVKVVDWLDGRYAPMAAVEDLAYSALKKDIRELRDRIEVTESEVERGYLLEDLESLIDRLCRNYPEDRECRE